MNKEELIESFKSSMKEMNVCFFAPCDVEQFRVELGTAGCKGGHIYADFKNEIKNEEALKGFVENVKRSLKEVEEERKQVEEQDNYWSNADNFI